jgi:hypothetical protein
MDFASLVPRPTDRALFVGQTGSGKTTLAREMLKYRAAEGKHIAVLDPKGTLDWSEYQRHTSLASLVKARAPLLLYRPKWEELETGEAAEGFFKWAYLREHTTVYVDETYAVTQGDTLPRYYLAGLTRGREKGVEIWSATQRPMRIPQVVMSESEHTYAFRLTMPQDRAKVESMTGLPQDRMHRLPKHHFHYAPQDGDSIGPLKLSL